LRERPITPLFTESEFSVSTLFTELRM